MSDGSDYDVGDNDVDEKNHDQIVEKVLNLNKVQQLKKASRTEPSLKISEFNLVKSIAGKKGSIELESLTKSLKNRKKHIEISNKLESSKKKSHTLPKPLEKPQAERIRRTVGYEKSRFEFDRWEALVQSNRAAVHQVFPLGSQEKIKVEEKNALKFPSTWRVKSDIQKELEKLDNKVEEYHIDDQKEENQFPLTLKELKEQRHEAAKLRAHQSFKEAKARRQNKIKSKKYHRILRKERVKKKLKEFEELQKTDPEGALKKLEEIEKARALERFSLRHKSTGQWAKSKQVRAKYDKDSRQVLAQQLSISRDLTQKLKSQNSDSEDDHDEIQENYNNQSLNDKSEGNPWINGPKPDKELSEFYSGYKKFWSEQDNVKNQKKLEQNVESLKNIPLQDDNPESNNIRQKGEISVSEQTNKKVEKKILKTKAVHKKSLESTKKLSKKRKISTDDTSDINNKTKTKINTKEKSSLNSSSGEWDIDQIFEKAEIKLEKKLKQKCKTVEKKKSQNSLKNKKPKAKKLKKSSADLSMPKQSKKHVIDEEMIEKTHDDDEEAQNDDQNILKLKNILTNATSELKINSNDTDIVPDQFIKPKPVTLNSENPDLIVDHEDTDITDQQKAIIEAFEDDAIDADFSKEKQEDIDKDTPKDIDLNLPGWGSWAGAMINPKKQRKRKRFIIKMPKQMPRRDGNKGSLIINEKATKKIKSHLVSEVPFPFKTVKDFEASIRAPIGNTFVPETAFRKLIKPEVETKMGAIIEPMTKSILMGKRKR